MGKSFSTERGIVYIDGYADSSAEAISKGYCFSSELIKTKLVALQICMVNARMSCIIHL